MKKVCFVLHTDIFTPWPIIRAMKEIDVLKEHDFEISVVSWIKGDMDLPSTEVRNGIKVNRFFLQPPKKSFLKRIGTYLKISKLVAKKITELKPNAVICHDLEMLYACVKAKKILKSPLFYDSHEDWPLMVAENNKFEAKCFAILEKRLLRHVTFSYTYSDELTHKFKNMGFSATTLYNSKSLDVVPPISNAGIKEIRKQLGFGTNDFIIGFAGSVSLKNGTQQVIDVLKLLPDNFKFLIVGGGGQEEDLKNVKRYIAEKGVQDRVVLTGRVKSQDLLRYSATFDVGTALIQDLGAMQRSRIPNKLFDYMAVSVPMIVSDFPNMKSIVVKESDCGIAVSPMDIESISKAIKHFHENREEAEQKGRKGRAKFEELYSWDNQKKKLIASHPFWRGEI